MVTASSIHADRVRDAVAARADEPAVARFLARHRVEPFVVVDVAAAQGLQRDAVVLSLGFGRTPHGRVLHRFGAITEPGGDMRLIEALTAVRASGNILAANGWDTIAPWLNLLVGYDVIFIGIALMVFEYLVEE